MINAGRLGLGLGLAMAAMAAGCAAGCASAFSACPASGGPIWRELSTDHFVLRTDADIEDARATLRDLENLRAALLTCFQAPASLDTGRIPVVVVRDGWDEFSNVDTLGIFTQTLFRPLIVLRFRGSADREETIKHELVHFFSKKVAPIQPLWFAEGLATYYQTVEYDLKKRQVIVGRPPADHLRTVQQTALLDAGEMRAAKGIGSDQNEFFYSAAWLMTHYLMNHDARGLLAYQTALQRMPEAEAWASAFPDLPGDQLNGKLRTYLDGGAYSLLIYPFDPPWPSSSSSSSSPLGEERTLTDADVHATRALLLAVGARAGDKQGAAGAWAKAARASGEIDEALRQEPSHVLGQAIKHWELHSGVGLADARLASERNPNDWLAWLLLFEALRERKITEGQLVAAENADTFASEDAAVTLKMTIVKPLPKVGKTAKEGE